MNVLLIINIFFCISLLASEKTFKVAGIENYDEFKSFYLAIQANIKANNLAELSKSFTFPITAYVDRKSIIFNDEAAFIEGASVIFTNTFKKAISCQNFNDLNANYKGVFGVRGAIWMNLVYINTSQKYDPKIHSDTNDRELWQYKVTGLTYSNLTDSFVKQCTKKEKQRSL